MVNFVLRVDNKKHFTAASFSTTSIVLGLFMS